jgi:hypothetical protein
MNAPEPIGRVAEKHSSEGEKEPFSLLGLSAGARILWAFVIVAMLWLAVFWAMGGGA